MALAISSLASSSSGNCYLIKSDEATILLDVGISVKRIKENLEIKSIDLSEVDAILVTHEHVDHVKSLKALLKKTPNARVYASKGTYLGIKEKYEDIAIELAIMEEDRVLTVAPGESFLVNDIEVLPFNVSHDTNEPVAYSFKTLENGGISEIEKRVSVVTDTGFVSEEIFKAIKDSDVLILESNHEPDILMYGRYPYQVKKRILSDYGHLSNEACANCLIRILDDRKEHAEHKMEVRKADTDHRMEAGKEKASHSTGDEAKGMLRVFLAHLSTENNTPEQAVLTVSNLLEEAGYYVGKELSIEPLRKDEASKFIFI